MSAETDAAFAVDFHRMLGDGVTYRDLVALRAGIAEPGQWCDAWAEAATVHEGIARTALARGFRATAAEAFWRASLYCHFGQGHFTAEMPEKRAAVEARKVALFAEAAPLLAPPLARVEIPFDGALMPAYLRLPAGAGPAPCVVLFGGLGSTKEDSLSFGDLCLARGLATIAFDGPGQGETHAALKLAPDFERSVSAAIDFLASCDVIDSGRIAIVGRSTGGHWAVKAAAADKRIVAAIAWGMIYALPEFAAVPPGLLDLFVHAAGARDRDGVRPILARYDLAGIAPSVTSPLLVVQGGRDPIATVEGAMRLMNEAPGPVELLSFPDSVHCCHDRSFVVKPAMADFLAAQLRAAGARAI